MAENSGSGGASPTPRASSRPPLRLFRPSDDVAALGLSVNYLMTKPAFARIGFGEWSRILVGQINRGHFWFVLDADDQIQGFVGWALASREKAQAWVEGRAPLSFEDSKVGDCVVFNAWSANSRRIHLYMIRQRELVFAGKAAVYFKRYYADGRTRPVRLALRA